MPIAFSSSGEWDSAHNAVVNGSIVVGSLTNPILVVFAADREFGGDTALDGLTSDQDGAFTQVGSNVNNGFANAQMWYLLGPSVATHDITPSYGDSVPNLPTAFIWALFTGVHQTTPFGTPATNTGSDDSPTVTATTAAGELVIHSLAVSPGQSVSAEGADQTEIETNFASAGTGSVRCHASYQAGADGGVMSNTLASSGTWAVIAASLKPAEEGGNPVGINKGRINRGRISSGLINRETEKINGIWQRPTRLLVPVGIQLQGV